MARLRGTESDEKRGGRERERENIAEIRAITNDDNNYAPVFIVTRHATEILLSTVVFSLFPLSSPFLSRLAAAAAAAAQASRPCEKRKKGGKKKSLTSRPFKSRIANDRERSTASHEPIGEK